VRQPADHRVPRCALAPAPSTPPIRFDHPARQHRAIGLQALPDHDEAELVQARERGQVRASEGSVTHVEVFQMGSVRTSILGRPRPLPGHRHADRRYTLNCEEPANGRITKTESLSKKFRADHLASCVGRVDMVLVSAFFMVIAP